MVGKLLSDIDMDIQHMMMNGMTALSYKICKKDRLMLEELRLN